MIVVLPILFPLVAAAAAMVVWRWVAIQRWIGVVGTAAQLVAGIALLTAVLRDGIQVVEIGNWPAPFSIVLVADLLSASLVLVTGALGVAVTLASFGGIDNRRESFGYYPLLLVLLVGVCGAFLTGDIFNLFVWFEVMLIASFVLLALGGERAQLEGAIKYVTINLIGSAMFLSAAGILYGMTGTLNMADLSLRLAALDSPILEATVAMLLLVVFGIKAAIFPLFSWLPASYHTPPTVVSAIFAGLLTKVGVYALFRTFTLLLPPDGMIQPLLIGIAALTMLAGSLGAVSQVDLRRVLSFLVIGGVGFMLMGLSLFTAVAIGAGVFYLLQDAVAKTALFLTAGLMRRIGGSFDLGELGGLTRASPLLIPLFAIPALSLAGIPPMAGFVAKIGLVAAALEVDQALLVAAALVASFLTLFAVSRVWMEAFWKSPQQGLSLAVEGRALRAIQRVAFSASTAALVIVLVAVGLAAEPVVSLSLQAGEQLADPRVYIDAVLGPRP